MPYNYVIYKIYVDNGQKVNVKGKYTYTQAVESVDRLNKTAKGCRYYYESI